MALHDLFDKTSKRKYVTLFISPTNYTLNLLASEGKAKFYVLNHKGHFRALFWLLQTCPNFKSKGYAWFSLRKTEVTSDMNLRQMPWANEITAIYATCYLFHEDTRCMILTKSGIKSQGKNPLSGASFPDTSKSASAHLHALPCAVHVKSALTLLLTGRVQGCGRRGRSLAVRAAAAIDSMWTVF